MISFSEYVMAMNRVEERLRKVAQALDAASIPYAVIGGNAVAAWITTVDPAATRTTKDVDLLVRREHADRVTAAMETLGFQRLDMRDFVIFLDPEEPSKRSGVHLVWAGERVRPSHGVDAPLVEEAIRSPQGFSVLTLAALVRMKLTSFRPIDQAHVGDLLEVGLIDAKVRSTLPPELLERLEGIEMQRDNW